jgi:hypothetical protein
VLLGLCAARIHYTTHLPLGDPLNQGHPFFGARPPRIYPSFPHTSSRRLGRCRASSRLRRHDPLDPLHVRTPLFSIAPSNPTRSLRTIHHRHHTSLFHTFLHSLLGLFLLTIAFLAGAGVANKYWAHLGWCWTYHACRILTVLLAFAWGAGILSAILFLIDLVWVARHRAWRQPMHGYYEQERKGWFRR